jgi:hypothetical protein
LVEQKSGLYSKQKGSKAVSVIQVNGPLGLELQQTKIKNKIMLAIARKMGTKQNDKETAAKKFKRYFRKKISNSKFIEPEDNQDYQGLRLGQNVIMIPLKVRTIKNIAMGEVHMVAHCVNETGEDQLYVMG